MRPGSSGRRPAAARGARAGRPARRPSPMFVTFAVAVQPTRKTYKSTVIHIYIYIYTYTYVIYIYIHIYIYIIPQGGPRPALLRDAQLRAGHLHVDLFWAALLV